MTAQEENEKLQARVEKLEAAAKYACAEWREDWELGQMSIDTNDAIEALAIAAAEDDDG